MKRICSLTLALAASLFVYVFYRSDKTVINELVKLACSIDRYAGYKSTIAALLPLNEIIVYSLPGGLWIFCATLLAQDFYVAIGRYRIQVIYIPILFAVGLEFFQLMQITNGRFDVWDIVFYLLFWLTACLGFQSRNVQQNILAPFTVKGFMCLACFFSVYLAHVNH